MCSFKVLIPRKWEFVGLYFAAWEVIKTWLSGKESASHCRRHGLNPWVRKIPWRRKWQPTLGFMPGETHGQRSLMGYSLWSCQEPDMTEHKHEKEKIWQLSWVRCQELRPKCSAWQSSTLSSELQGFSPRLGFEELLHTESRVQVQRQSREWRLTCGRLTFWKAPFDG